MSFFYSQEVSNAFDSNSSKDVPPVHELFAGFIGPYRYLTQPLNTETACGAQMSVNEPRSLRQAHGRQIPKHQPILQESYNVNSKTGNPVINSQDSELMSDIINRDEEETFLADDGNEF